MKEIIEHSFFAKFFANFLSFKFILKKFQTLVPDLETSINVGTALVWLKPRFAIKTTTALRTTRNSTARASGLGPPARIRTTFSASMAANVFCIPNYVTEMMIAETILTKTGALIQVIKVITFFLIII